MVTIDINIQKFKTRFGDKLKTVVVDYVNQINIPDIYNWQTQIMLSNKLKEFARKLRKSRNLAEVLFWNEVKSKKFH